MQFVNCFRHRSDGVADGAGHGIAALAIGRQGMAPADPAVVGDGSIQQQPAIDGVKKLVVVVVGVGQVRAQGSYR